MVSPVAGSEGPVPGTAWTSASPSPPGWGGSARAMPGSAAAIASAFSMLAAGPTSCSVPGAPGPKAADTCSKPWRDESSFGTTAIEGMPVVSPRTGIESTISATRAGSP